MTQVANDAMNEGAHGASRHYTKVAIGLHWLIAALLLAQIGFGWFLGTVARGSPLRGYYVNMHKSTGMVLAVLILARIAWRLLNQPPDLPAWVPSWQRLAARWSHIALYVCMIGMPLSGYIASNFSKHGVKFFNAVMLPPWGVDNHQVYALFNTTHVVLSYAFVALIVVHILAAIQHTTRRDGVINRMVSPSQ
ncbi:MAG TPA: cytochrome b [Steroidobacteraceae bacterium]